MKVWIDQDLCTGDGLCEEIAPDVESFLPILNNIKIFLNILNFPS